MVFVSYLLIYLDTNKDPAELFSAREHKVSLWRG